MTSFSTGDATVRYLTRITSWLAASTVLAACCCCCPTASATVHTLVDGNSRIEIDTDSPSGMSTWAVNGGDQLTRQWFWFRVAGDTAEQSLDTLPIVYEATENANADPAPERLFAIYGDPRQRFEISVDLLLAGGGIGSPNSSLVEAIRIYNHQDTTLSLTFFQYVDFDLGGTAANDLGQLVNVNTVLQSDGPKTVSESVVTPRASRYQVDLYPTILSGLNDASLTNLTNSAGPVTGDVSWSFQWNINIPPDGAYLISKIKTLSVPEPAPWALAAVGLLGVLLAARRPRNH